MSSIRVIRPEAGKRRPPPLWALVVATVGVGLFGFGLHPPSLWLRVVGVCLAGFAGAGLASWGEALVFGAYENARPAVRALVSLTMPLVAIVLTPPLAVAVLVLGDFPGEPLGVLVVVGGLWFLGAAMGSSTVVLIDIVVSLIVGRFRTRILVATSVLVFGALGMSGLFAVVVDSALRALETVPLDQNFRPASVRVVLEMIREDQSSTFLLLLGVGAVITLPAVMSAVGKLADAVMERIQPLVHAMDAVAGGARDVRLEEAGSYDFVEVSRHFNRMVETLEIAERLERAFGAYVSPKLLREIRRQRGGAILPRVVREATVLFADVRGFTTLSEARAPDEVVTLLNLTLSKIVDVIDRHDGYLDKFIGDAVLVGFNVLVDQQDHAARAARCAEEMVAAVDALNEDARFDTTVSIGVGIATGAMFAGNIGGGGRTEFTVIGDTVNTAARLEAHTRVVDAPILMTRATADGAARGISLGEVTVKGKDVPVEIFALGEST